MREENRKKGGGARRGLRSGHVPIGPDSLALPSDRSQRRWVSDGTPDSRLHPPQGLGQPVLGQGRPGMCLADGRMSRFTPGRLEGCCEWTAGWGELGRSRSLGACPPTPQLLGLWDTPHSRALLPKLLRADRSPLCARRDVSRRCRLRPGHYLVVPCAARAGDEADFTLRIFSERRHTAV